MLVSISREQYESLVKRDLLSSVNEFWSVCVDKWFGQQSRMVSLYIDEQQAKEETINRDICDRSNSTTPELLPPPTENQKQLQKFYLTKWEGTPTTYYFYDVSTGKPTLARWLRKFLDNWDAKLNDPFGDEVVAHRSLKGSIKKGKPQDPLLECYLRNRNNINAVLAYCMTINDLTVMEATSNIGGHRGPFGEFASAADKVLKDKIKKQKASHSGELAPEDQYDLLIDSGSKFFLTMNALNSAFEVFTAALNQAATDDVDQANLPQEYEIDVDLLSPSIEQYCKAMKSAIERAVKFKKLLQELFNNKYKDINLLVRKLFEIIMTLNSQINFFVNAKLAEVQPENYQPALDFNPNSIAKIELPLSDDKFKKLLDEQAQNEIDAQNSKEISPPTPAKRDKIVPPSASAGQASASLQVFVSPRGQQDSPSTLDRRSSSSRKSRRQQTDEVATTTPRRDELQRRATSPRPPDEFFSPRGSHSSRRGGSVTGTPRRQVSTSRIDRASSGKSIMEQAAAKTMGNS